MHWLYILYSVAFVLLPIRWRLLYGLIVIVHRTAIDIGRNEVIGISSILSSRNA
jgi:ABC-type sulfate transport system permease subunit